MINKIKSKQLILIKKIKNFYINNIKNFDSSISFFSSFSQDSSGYGILKYWIDKRNFFLLITIFAKNFILSFYNYDFFVFKNKKKYSYNKIIISWSNSRCFNKNGSYNDKYFNINSRVEKKTLWFLIHLDKKIPKKIDSNIVILSKKKIIFNYTSFLNFVFNIKNILLNLKTILDKQSYLTKYGFAVGMEFKKFLNEDVNKILILYEGQPFQNIILKISKNYNKNISSVGYVHSFPPALPLNLFNRDGAPDKIIVNGKDQKYCFNKFLNWQTNKIIKLDSIRFGNKYKNMYNCIFLPINLSSTGLIVKQLKVLIKKGINISNFKINNHPHCLNSKKHLKLIQMITSLKKENYISDQNLNTNNKISIFIGTTSSIIEALERKVEVIHIMNEPALEMYSDKLWPSIKVKYINKNILKYSIKKYGSLIQFNKNNKYFKNYFKIT